MSNKDLKKNILHKIESGDIAMKSKVHFLLRTILLATGLLLVAVVTLFLISFVVFVMRANGVFMLGTLGGHGLIAFLLSVPWLLILLILVLVGTLEVLGKYFAFVYRKPLVYSALSIVLISSFAGTLLASSSLHSKTASFVQNRNIPIGKPLYDRYNAPNFKGGAHVGVVTNVDERGFMLITIHNKELLIATSSETRQPKNSNITTGDTIIVVGKSNGSTFEAYGIKPYDARKTQDIFNPRPLGPPESVSPGNFRKNEINRDIKSNN